MRLVTILVVSLLLVSANAQTNIAPIADQSTAPPSLKLSPSLENIVKNIATQVPELTQKTSDVGKPPWSSEVFAGGEYASGAFYLTQKVALGPQGLARERIPYPDLQITIHRYTTSGDAQLDLGKRVSVTSEQVPPKENYQGGVLYQYGPDNTIIFQAGLYFIEIDQISYEARLLPMKVLDAILAQINPPSAKSNSVNPTSAVSSAVKVEDIKITFEQSSVAPPSGMAPEAKWAGIKQDPNPANDGTTYVQLGIVIDPSGHGAFSNIVAGQIAALKVTWTDPERFNTKSQTEDFLRELLSNQHEETYTFHAWSFADGVPCIVATVEHTDGKPGKLMVWPMKTWAYLDGTGRWWFGMWHGTDLKMPKP